LTNDVEIVENPPFQWKKVFADIAEFGGERHFFFGNWYWIKKGEEYGYDYVLVLDNGRYVVSLQDLKDISVSFRRMPEVKPSVRWSASHLKRFIEGEQPNPPETAVYDLCLEAYKRYIDYVEPGAPTIMALYTIQTYLMPIFDTTAYIMFSGTKKSGKSRNLDVAEQLVFNPLRTIDMTPSSLFRCIQDWQSTVLIDEADLDLPDRAPVIRTILNAGYRRGNYVTRTEKSSRDKHFVEQYDVFGPKIIVAPFGVAQGDREQMLFDRCIPITMQRTTDPDITKRKIDPKDSYWWDIRNHLYHFALKHWREIEKNYSELPGKLDLMSREYEKWSPLFAIAEYFGIFDELLKICREKVGEVFLEEESESSEVKLLRYVIKLYRDMNNDVHRFFKESVDGFEGYYVSASDLVDKLHSHYGKESWINPQRVGRIMTNVFGLKIKPLKIVRHGKPYYLLTESRLESLAKKYGINFDNPLES
jgi:hypothetical protein